MATVYSLVCWAGSGIAVTFTDAGDLVNWTNHGVRQYEYGTTLMVKRVQFTTDGSLPTGLDVDTDYYAIRSTDNALILYPTNADAIAGTNQVTFSGTGYGAHIMIGGYYLSLTSAQKLRYGAAGSERIFGGLHSWYNSRSGSTVNLYDTEVVEIGEAFTELTTTFLSVNLDCSSIRIETYINNIRSGGFHSGKLNAGYIIKSSSASYNNVINLLKRSTIVDGITVEQIGSTRGGIVIGTDICTVRNCIHISTNRYGTYGIQMTGSSSNEIYNNIFYKLAESTASIKSAIWVTNYQGLLSKVYNNLCIQCYIGFSTASSTNCKGKYFNNIIIGCIDNWGVPPNFDYIATNNFGESGDTDIWTSATGVTYDNIESADFTDYSGLDFTPASKSSHQVLSGLPVYDGDTRDMLGKVRPAYINITHSFSYDNLSGVFTLGEMVSWGTGTARLIGNETVMQLHLVSGLAPVDNDTIIGALSAATCDVNGTVTSGTIWVQAPMWSSGPIEYDWGGPSAFVSVTLQNIADGSRYRVYNTTTDTVLATGEQSGTSDILIENIAFSGSNETLKIDVRKSSSAPYYKPFSTNAILGANGASVYVSQELDTIAGGV